MKAVVYSGDGHLSVQNIRKPMITDSRDAIVKVSSSAICGSDIHLKNMLPTFLQPGQVIGHEFVGYVDEVGDGISSLKVGDRVVGACSRFCGRCENCLRGLYAHCTDFACLGAHPFFDGAQAEFVRIPYADSTLFKFHDSLSDEQILFAGDILSTGYMAAEYGEVCPGKTVVVFGCGPVGISAMICAKLFTPSRIIGVEPNQARREMCLRRNLADYMIDPQVTDPIAEIYNLTEFKGADVCIEAIGNPTTLNQAMVVVRPSGNVVTVGFFTEPFTWPLNALWMKNMTIRHGFVQVNQIGKLINLIENNKIDASFMVTHTLPLSDALTGYEIFEKQLDGVIKVILKP